ncbi:MAG: UDP-4-amino-4,6-dideoxy-N-acetyl-beta-L-altrosamine transaminase [Candidatus Riflebacteria bacterium HGW-Riflebacteria-2]|jgi:UDP-4-amino-4,6-dideoxy-N-acetyl-beta-L-altrosamine transaminase|nr:MAG: UDP-4-amino-4,6-dideoxy-N-acetyl-beta-L-altrosamine transaminase [Candidatus Riflebacteria bacterium HGW-Riflebacteria-2]
MKFIPYGRQDISREDIEAVVAVLKSDYLTQGPAVESFEKAVCLEAGAGHAIACSNGTAALHLACMAAGLHAGEVAVTSAITFVASANCARYVGADVRFADIDPETLTMSPLSCRRLLAKAQSEGRPVKVVVTVDFAGHPCDMQAFARLKQEFGFIWIQDACHSIGATWEDSEGIRWKVGEWPAPDMTVFSFHPVKHITTGEGGMILTHDDELAGRLRMLRTHGITREPAEFSNSAEAFAADGTANPWYYEMQQLGFNYRLTDLQAALGESQLHRLAAGIVRRREIVAAYQARFSGHPHINFPGVAEGVWHAYHLAVAMIDFTAAGKSRAAVMKDLRQAGIGTQVHYIPVPLMPYYQADAACSEIPQALAYYGKALSLPCFPQLIDNDIERICSVLEVALA